VGPYREEQIALLRQIARHWTAVCRLRRDLAELLQEQRIGSDFGNGLVLIDGNGGWLWGNAVAEAMRAERWLSVNRQGRLELRDARANASLQNHLARVARPGGPEQVPVVVVRDHSGAPVAFAGVHALGPGLPVGMRNQRARFVLVFRPFHAPMHPAVRQVLSEQFAMTESEIRLALACHQHESLAAAAEALALRPQTARSRIQSILEKTGAASQRELVAMLDALARTCRSLSRPKQKMDALFHPPWHRL
jgi:hypothetical protein